MTENQNGAAGGGDGASRSTHTHRARRLQRPVRIAIFFLAARFAAQPVCGSGPNRASTSAGKPCRPRPFRALRRRLRQRKRPTLLNPGLADPRSGHPDAARNIGHDQSCRARLRHPVPDVGDWRSAKIWRKGDRPNRPLHQRTVSNTRGIGGTGTAYAQQVDVGASFDLDKLGIWSDAVARFAMTDRAGRSLAADRTGSYFAYQEVSGRGKTCDLTRSPSRNSFCRRSWP